MSRPSSFETATDLSTGMRPVVGFVARFGRRLELSTSGYVGEAATALLRRVQSAWAYSLGLLQYAWRRGQRRQALLSLATILALLLQPVFGLLQIYFGVPAPRVVDAHNLDSSMVSMYFDPTTQALIDSRVNNSGTPLLQSGDTVGLIIKVIPDNGTQTGVGGYVDFYIPNGVQVTDAAYVIPNGSGGYDPVPMKGQSPIAIGDGPIGTNCTPALGDPGRLTHNSSVQGGVIDAVTATGCHNGTIAGVYGDTGIFYATDPRTAYGSYSGGTLKNNSGDTTGWRTTLGTPLNQWDTEQLAAFGISGTTNPSYPSSPIVDPNGRGNAPWGNASAVAGPQSGYAWEFTKSVWDGNQTAAGMKAALSNVGPWQRIKYAGSFISKDQPGLKSTVLGTTGVDASNVGFDLAAGDLPATTSQTDTSSPKTVRWAIGQLTYLRPEYVWVQFKVNQTSAILNPSGCPNFHADTFGGDAGGASNGKDHIWRYYDPTETIWNPCLAISKPANRAVTVSGDTVTYKVTVYNMGPNNLTNVVVKDTLPSGVTFISAVPAQNSGPNPLQWNVGNLNIGQKFQATVTVKASGSGILTNSLTVTSNELPPVTTQEKTPSGSVPYLNQTKSVSPTSVAPGGTVQYTIKISNIGSGPTGSPVQIQEFLPTGFTYVSKDSVTVNGASVTGTTTVNSTNPNSPIFSVPSAIGAGKDLVLTFTAQVGATVTPGTYCNSYLTTQNSTPEGTGSLACLSVGGGQIGDTVYRDWNGNGTQDATDEGLPGVTMNLYAGACPPSGGVIQTKTTDASGKYLFTGLNAGAYCVDAPTVGSGGVPSGYTLTTANDPLTVNLAANQQFLTADFGYKPGGTASIGDTVFEDLNNSGAQNAGEPGILGVTVQLYEDTNGNGVLDPAQDGLIATTTTNANGNYQFTGLDPARSYLIKAVDGAGSAVDTYFANAYISSTGNPVAVGPAQFTAQSNTVTTADLGYFGQTPGSIGDQLCIDLDQNGLCGAGEPGLPGLTVSLYRDTNGDGIPQAGELVTTTLSSATGTYSFPNLGPSNYIVTVDPTDPNLPALYTPEVATVYVPLAAGQNVTTADFPYAQLLKKTVDKANANAGDTLTYTISPYYAGPSLLTNAVISDVIPSGTTYVANSANASGVYSNTVNAVIWDLGSNSPAVPGITSPTGTALCPVNVTLSAIADTYIDKNKPTDNAGADTTILTRPTNANSLKYSLLKFDTSSIPAGAVIQSAALNLRVTGNRGNHFDQVHTMITPWTEGTGAAGSGATWNTRNGATAWAAGAFSSADYQATTLGTFVPKTNNVTLSVNIANAVNDWVNNSVTNNGLALISTGTDGGDAKYASRENGTAANRPALKVTYLTPTVGGCSSPVGGTVLTSTADTYIQKGSATANQGTATTMVTNPGTNNTTNNTNHSLVQFDLSSIPPGATITSATLQLTVTANRSNHVDDIRRMLTPWTETGATWNTRNGTTSWASGGAFSSSDYGTTSWGTITPSSNGAKTADLTSLVNNWINNGYPKNGIVLVSTGTDNGDAKYATRENGTAADRPILTVNWTLPPNAAGQTFTTLTATPLLQTGPGQVKVTMTASVATGSASVTPPASLFITASGPTATLASGPTPAGPVTVTPGNPAIFTYIYNVTAGSVPGQLTFSGMPTAPSTTFATGQSETVLVTPPLTFQVTVNNPATVPLVTNTAGIEDDGGITPTPSNSARTDVNSIPNQPDASIGDTVWSDTNGNGVQDPGEPGLPNVTVTLTGPGCAPCTTTTDALGKYLFPNLTSGAYSVTYSGAPAGYVPTTPVTLNVTLATGQQYTTADFGLQPPGTGSIGDTVWLDANNNGALDGTEAGLPGVTVKLYKDMNNNGVIDAGDVLVDTEITSATGNYSFTGLPAAAYLVQVDSTSTVTTPQGGTTTIGAAMAATSGTLNPKPVTLSAGQTVTTADFGYNWSGSIGDYVWRDNNINQTPDPGEPPIAGAAVLLYYDINGNGVLDPFDPPAGFATTDANGNYTLPNLPPGAYLVDVYEDSFTVNGDREAVPTTPDVRAVTLAPSQQYIAADFGYYTGALVEGHVFHDADRNGVFDGAETGLQPVTVTLTGSDLNGNPVTRTTTTNASGYFSFIVPEGNYTVTYNQPSVTAINPSLTTTTTATSYAVAAQAGPDWHVDLLFGVDNTGQIGDTVFNDANANGVQNAGEAGLAGVTVNLYTDVNNNGLYDVGTDTFVATQATDANGKYLFTGLADGAYVVVVDTSTVPSGWTQKADPDQPGVVCTTCNNQSPATISGGNSILTKDFGYQAPTPTFTVSGTLWQDNNANGAIDVSETVRLANTTVVVKVDTNGDSVPDITYTTTTDASGNYSVSGIPQGSTVVIDPTEATLPQPGYVQTAPLPIPPGTRTITNIQTNQTAQNFGYQLQLGSISGTVCQGNGDGQCTAGETGLAGVTVTLRYAGPDGLLNTADDVVTTTTTNANGQYTFTNLQPGLYQVTETNPVGLFSVGDADGGNPDNISVTLAAGQNVTTRDFEDAPPTPTPTVTPTVTPTASATPTPTSTPNTGSLNGTVYNDQNGNGVRDLGEPGIPSVTVKAYTAGPDGVFGTPDDVLIGTTTTDANGNYSFPNVPAGGVQVVETDPAGYSSTTPNTVVTAVPGGGTATVNFGDQQNTPTPTVTSTVTATPTETPGIKTPTLLPEPTDTKTPTLTNTPSATATATSTATPTPSNTPTSTVTPTTAPNSGTVTGVVFNDINGNGSQGVGEPGLPGVTVQLVAPGPDGVFGTPDDVVVSTTTTNGTGAYTFPNVTPGVYQVIETDPPGYSSTTPNTLTAVVVAGGTSTANFGDQQNTPTPTATQTPTPTNTPTNTATPSPTPTSTATPAPATITGAVYNDVNGNATLDGGETGIPGVSVALFGPGPDGIFGTPDDVQVATTTTGAGGTYTFPNVTPGVYEVRETQPSGYTSTTPNNVVVVAPAGGTSTVNFGEQLNTPTPTVTRTPTAAPNTGAITGVVFNDVNSNQTRDLGEPGIPGVTVTLYSPGPDGVIGTGDDVLVATTTTDPTGAYSFPNLPPGTYGMVETDPSGYTSTTPNSLTAVVTAGATVTANFGDRQSTPTPTGTATNTPLPTLTATPTPTNTATATPTAANTLTPTATATATLVNTNTPTVTTTPLNTSTPTVTPTTAPNTGVVRGTVFNDVNGNGSQSVGEPGLPGVTVSLYGTGPDNTFGTPDDVLVATTTTDPTGGYLFPNVTPGVYEVRETDPAGYTSTTPNNLIAVVVAAGTATANFGDQQATPTPTLTNTPTATATPLNTSTPTVTPTTAPNSGTVTGVVFNDINGNGSQGVGEPGLPGVTVQLVAPGPDGVFGTPDDVVVSTTTTNGTGAYTFPNVTPGVYQVIETDPPGYSSTTPNTLTAVVVAGGTSTANFGDQQNTPTPTLTPTRTPSPTATITLTPTPTPTRTATATATVTPAQSPTPTPTATTRPAVVQGTVFNDLNGNGVQDPGEPGLPGVTVTLVDPSNATVATTTTDPNGDYIFPSVTPGTYTVRETDPAGFSSTTPNTVPVSVAPGSTIIADFGDRAPGSVTGVVFNDVNGNGVQDVSESPINGVTVTLVAPGPDGIFGTGDDVTVGTTTTAGSGTYLFSGLTPGPYLVKETDPAGFTSTTPNTVPVSVPTGGSAVANFGDQAIGTVNGTVFNDLNGNGVQDPGESGLPGVTVTLVGPGPDGILGTPDDTTVGTTTTALNGTYLIPNVTPGPYLVKETDPAGYASTTPNSVPITVPAGGSASADFGDRLPGAVVGAVYNDLNGNGVQDPGEPGLPGVTVTLVDPDGDGILGTPDDVVVGATTTDANGNYSFSGVNPGPYGVKETDPAGFTSTTPNTVPVTVPAGGVAVANYGDQQLARINGTIYHDLNSDTNRQVGEPGLAGVTVTLYSAGPDGLLGTGDDVIVATTTTAPNGDFSFGPLPSGAYLVRETDPAGFTSTTPNAVIVSVPPAGSASVLFGDNLPGAVAGTVTNDLNANGTAEAGEPGLQGVTLRLLGPGPDNLLGTVDDVLVATTTTDASGNYLFTGVPAGSYQVRETDPAGFTSTSPNVVPVVVPAGGTGTANFTDTLIGSVAGTVYNDLNGDGTQDPGEVGLSGVTVELVNASNVVIATTTTAPNGGYQFLGVPAGTYTVRETDPTGFTSTTPNSVTTIVPPGGIGHADFGDRAIGSISGVVFTDLNNNGVQDPGETGIPGVVVTLRAPGPDGIFGTPDDVLTPTTTAGDGTYSFTGVTPGPYQVTETDPTGYSSTTPNTVPLTVPAGGSASANFGDLPIGMVTGVVFDDPNGSGVQDPGETGLGGVTIRLYAPGLDGILGTADDLLVATTTTLPDGSYQFLGVTAGPYQVRETDPAGFNSTTPNTVPVTVPAGGAGVANFGDQLKLQPTNAQIRSFDATLANRTAMVRWETATEVDVLGFRLWRSDQPDFGYTRVSPALIPSQISGPSGASYDFVEPNLPVGTWYYKLEVVATSGQLMAIAGPVSVTVVDYKGFMPLIIRSVTLRPGDRTNFVPTTDLSVP